MADDDDSDNFELFQKILALLSWKRKDEFCDKLSNKVTTLILVIFAAVVTFYQFLNPPIVCWCPAHFTGKGCKCLFVPRSHRSMLGFNNYE